MTNVVLIGGEYNEENGRPSGYIRKFGEELKHFYPNIKIKNGGNINELKNMDIDMDILFWFPEMDNKYSKLLNDFKSKNQKMYLIQSKYNGGRYTIIDLVARALKSKSNLLVEFNKEEEGIKASIIDPLGNMYYDGFDIKEMTKTLYERLSFLTEMKRQRSSSVGMDNNIPKEKEFFKVVEDYGQKFHKLVHAINQNRYLGNCSFREYNFRCTHGFPSFKKEGFIYVSKRNLDKREINENCFVKVRNNDNEVIEYYGDHPPSVDTPIQRELYRRFKNINYMIHSHVYLKDGVFTKKVIPCGSVNEVEEIIAAVENTENTFYKINLIGHGCLIMSDDIEKMKDLEFISRNTPEIQIF